MDEETETAAGATLRERMAALEARHAQLDALATRGLGRLGDQQSEQLDRLRGELRRLRDELRALERRVGALEAEGAGIEHVFARIGEMEGAR